MVHEVGDHVSQVEPGDRVAIDPFHSLSCGNCAYCATGWFIHCRHPKVLGQSGFVEYLKLTEKGLHILPESVETHLAAIAEPAATPVSAVRRVGLRGGESVVVLGAGVLGIAAVGAAKALGAGKIIVTAKYEQQKQFAKQFGADVVISSDADNITALIQQHVGIGADVVIETVGGAAPTLQQAAEAATLCSGSN
ncbi:MAG: zinc-binding dehydrogenase [Halioglobus sp.]|nr:zinc-binding dehydrogenase [Halioglobus sp.]